MKKIPTDRVQPVRDGNDRAVLELVTNDGLHQLIRLDVDAGTDLVQHDDLAAPNQRPGQAEELALAVAEEVGRHDGVEAAFVGDGDGEGEGVWEVTNGGGGGIRDSDARGYGPRKLIEIGVSK